MLVSCLVCITCSGALDVSNFRLTGNTVCSRTARSLRQRSWGRSPSTSQLVNRGSFLLLLVSSCKRLWVCGIGEETDYARISHVFSPIGEIYITLFSVYIKFIELIFVIGFSPGFGVQYIVFANSFFLLNSPEMCAQEFLLNSAFLISD